MQVTLDRPACSFAKAWEYIKNPENRVTMVAASILLSSLFVGIKLLSISQMYGEVVMMAGAATGWSVYFSKHS